MNQSSKLYANTHLEEKMDEKLNLKQIYKHKKVYKDSIK